MFNRPPQTERSHFVSQSSLLLHGPVAISTHQDGSTLFTNWKKSKGCSYKARESLPLKPSSELWMNLWFNKLWCINRWLWRCVFGKSAWSKQEKRLLGQEFQTVYSEQTGEEDHNISWSINGSVGIYGHLLWSWISAPAECCHHTFIQWWINNSN